MNSLSNWDRLMNFKVRLIACGGTALTLLDIKESTKDVDFIVPDENEYKRLMTFLKTIGYREGAGGLVHDQDPLFIYQFWSGNRVFTTELFHSPLEKGQNILIQRWKHLYLGALNLNDLIMTKLFRGTSIDMEDCVAAFRKQNIDPDGLFHHFKEAARYDLNPDRVMKNFQYFIEQLMKEELIGEAFLKQVRSEF